ncbi:MAG: MFS transporter, partial [Actinomycetota bacterium]|nr:MFS transporter [Actinomycetota bacterium]
TAVYRGAVIDAIPADVPVAAADAARDTLGGALAVAGELPGETGGALLEAARAAFTQGLHLVSLTGAVVAIGIAILVATLLRDVERGSASEGSQDAEPGGSAAEAAVLENGLSPAIAES